MCPSSHSFCSRTSTSTAFPSLIFFFAVSKVSFVCVRSSALAGCSPAMPRNPAIAIKQTASFMELLLILGERTHLPESIVAKNEVQPVQTSRGKTLHGTSVRPIMTDCWFCPSLGRSEEHTSELQSQSNLVCRLLLEK